MWAKKHGAAGSFAHKYGYLRLKYDKFTLWQGAVASPAGLMVSRRNLTVGRQSPAISRRNPAVGQ